MAEPQTRGLISFLKLQFILIFIPRDILVICAHNPLGSPETMAHQRLLTAVNLMGWL